MTALIGGTLVAAQDGEFGGRNRTKKSLYERDELEVFSLAFLDELFDRHRNSAAKYQGALTLLRRAMARDMDQRRNVAEALFGEKMDSDARDPINSYLALWAIARGERNGMDVPSNFWNDADYQWREKQTAAGGWASGAFSKPAPIDFFGTAAGILSLSITTERLANLNPAEFRHHTGNYLDRDIETAAAWLKIDGPDIWTRILSGKSERRCQALWWLDQVMTQSGAIRLNREDDVTHMLQWLLHAQQPDGSWPGDLSETAYAVRVLQSHLRPAGVAKLAYGSRGKDGCWNQRPSDILHASRWLGKHLLSSNSEMRCLVVDIGGLQEDLSALPILFIAGDSELAFDASDCEALRGFVGWGGLIVGNADLGSANFNKSFEALGHQLFPSYEFREIPRGHPLFTSQIDVAKGKTNTVKLRGLSNGVRELMLLIPDADISLAWQNNDIESHPEAFRAFRNIVLYVNGISGVVDPSRELPVAPPEPFDHAVSIARLQIGDNWNAEPGAWTRMASMLQQGGVLLDVNLSRLQPGSLAGCKLAHLTGTTRFTLTPDQRRQLQDFVNKGGTLLIDAAGGSVEFADAAHAEMIATFGADAFVQLAKPMPADILFGANGLAPLAGNPRLYRHQVQLPTTDENFTPGLRVMKIGNRMAVFFSREDLSAAMAGVQSDDITGYRPEVGAALVRSILQYAEDAH